MKKLKTYLHGNERQINELTEMSMKFAPLTTKEEKELLGDMQRKLWEHSRYEVRKQYYPFKMDLWEHERKSIENEYRSKIVGLQKEMNARKLQEKKEMEKKREEEDKLNAAMGLLLLSKTKPTNQKEIVAVEPVRRSKRIAERVASS